MERRCDQPLAVRRLWHKHRENDAFQPRDGHERRNRGDVANLSSHEEEYAGVAVCRLMKKRMRRTPEPLTVNDRSTEIRQRDSYGDGLTTRPRRDDMATSPTRGCRRKCQYQPVVPEQ